MIPQGHTPVSPTRPSSRPVRPPPPLLAPGRAIDPRDRRDAAKWPPDESSLPPGGASPPGVPAGGGSPYGYDDGNFKRGATKPIAIVLAILIVLGGGAAVYFGMKQEGERMTVDQIAKEKKSLALMGKSEALPKWRQWAARADVPALQQEAFAQLAWSKDPEGLKSIIGGLTAVDHAVRGRAAQALLEYAGMPAADAAKPALLKALGEADASDKPQIAWALVALHEPSAFDAVLAEYRLGHLSKVQRLDEGPAFDPELFAGLVSLDKLASLSGDESASVRQLVATSLSRTGDAKWTDTLIKLVKDKEIEVARQAAVGLGKIANEKAMTPLLDALAKADKESRKNFLEALKDGIGAQGLVEALRSVQRDNPEREKVQTKVLFDMMRELEDPRGGDYLVQYLATNPKPHWRVEAALRLAEIGDLRAVPHLAWRMRQDPLKIYNNVDDPELRRDDNERVVAARMLADLAVLYPEKRAEIRKEAEDDVMFWLTDKPQPHANGLRFLAASDATDTAAITRLRKWADPPDKLPEAGAQGDFPPNFATAQSALRYLGWLKDPPAWGILTKQLQRRPEKINATMESLMQGGLAILGMTLKGLGSGAAYGFAQWGDPKAYPLLTKYIESDMDNEQSRLDACFSIAWVASDEQMKDVVKRVQQFNKPDPKNGFVRGCYLEALVHRPVPAATAGLIDLLKPDMDLEVRHQVARAIGFGGVTPEMAKQLMDKQKDENVRTDATLALLIGGDAETAGHALAAYNAAPPEAMEDLKGVYNQTFGYWSDKNYENGDVARWIENAEACAHTRVNDRLQDWPRLILSRALISGVEFDSGPHSVTRVQFRVRLMQDARGSNDAKRRQAIEILKFLKEKGVLMALKSENGPAQELARKAFFDVMNPKAVDDRLPDSPKSKDQGGKSP